MAESVMVAMAFFLIGGLFVTFMGVNLYRYAVIIMGAVGGYFLGNLFYDAVLGDNVGEGIFHDMNSSAGQSFVIAIFVLVTGALAFALYQIMSPIIGGAGGGFMFASLMVLLMGSGISSQITGWVIGLIIGVGLGIWAIYGHGWGMIIFTALGGARILSYCGSLLLYESDIGKSIAKPVATMISSIVTPEITRSALMIEIFLAATILGIIVQAFIRND